MPVARFIGVLSVAVAWLGVVDSARAVIVPPVVVSQLTHDHSSVLTGPVTITSDTVQFPCAIGACNGPGFTTLIGQGSTVEIRIEAPAGKRFQVTHTPGASTSLTINALWETFQGGGTFGTSETPEVLFENLLGIAPSSPSVNLFGVTNGGQSIRSHVQYVVNGNFNFTAVRIRFTVTNAVTPVFRTYGPVGSGLFGVERVVFGGAPNQTLMSITTAPPSILIAVPPIVVSDLSHEAIYEPQTDFTITRDIVGFPCAGNKLGECVDTGFTDSISTTDVVRTRIMAPVGHRFVVTRRPIPPGQSQNITYSTVWSTGVGGDPISIIESDVPVFEGVRGSPPTGLTSTIRMTTTAQWVSVDGTAQVAGDFSFTAITNEFQVLHSIANVLRTYGSPSGSMRCTYLVPGVAVDAGVVMRVAPPCPADVAYSESVNVQDLLAVIGAWGSCANPNDCPADIAPAPLGDDVVNVQDLLAVIGAWGACP